MELLAKRIASHFGLTALGGEIASLVLMLAAAAVVFVFGLLMAALVTWLERRVAGRIQSRVGPNRVGPLGLLQWMADGLKMILKEDVVPSASDRPLYLLAPYLVVIGVFSAFATVPFSRLLIAADLNVAVVYLVAVTSLVVVGLLMAGWASNNKWALLGGIRSAAQIVAYEVPTTIAMLSVVVLAGTLSLQEITRQQGGWPWQWYLFYNPFTFVAFFLYFSAAVAEGNRTPFDLPEAESELVAGYNTEYSGMRFGGFFLAEFGNVYLLSAIAACLFFGGWQVPGFTLEEQARSLGLEAAGFFLLFLKSWFGCFVVVWIRWTLPRLRVDQLTAVCYKYVLPLALACLAGNALYLRLAPEGGAVNGIVRLAMTALGGLLVAAFAWRVRFHLRRAGAPVDLDFLARGEAGVFDEALQRRRYGAFRRRVRGGA